MNNMNFKDYQDGIRHTLIYRDKIQMLLEENIDFGEEVDSAVVNLLSLSYVGLGLGEAGEIQGKIKKIIRDSGGHITDDHRQQIAGELGDLLWYIAATASELGLDLGVVAKSNLAKLAGRKERGVIEGSGDTR